MELPRLSQRQKAGLAVALAVLLWAPSGLSHGDLALVTGHSTFYDGDTFSPCLASVAGIIRHRVMWFNDQVLVETYGGAGTYIWVTEQGVADPRAASKLYSDGVFYDFVDPNGARWHVEEYYYDVSDDVVANLTVDRDEPWQSQVNQISMGSRRTMVWVVEVAPRPIFDEFAGADPHSYYNFLVLVDTCKIHANDANTSYDGIADHNNESGLLNDKYGHENGEKEHKHERYMMDIWVGKRPLNVVPNGVSTSGAQWQTEWAASRSAAAANSTTERHVGDLAP